MKHTVVIIVLLLFSQLGFAQEENAQGLEKSVFGVQTGVLGIYGYHEYQLAEKVALRTEIGLDASIFNSPFTNSNVVFFPKFSLEPRYYYNINKRAEKGKNTTNNAANFLSLYTNYRPNWFIIPDDNLEIIPDLLIAPTWGMKRNISNHFNYELGAGLGYYHTFAKSQGFSEDDNGLGVNLLLRIGYVF